MDKPNRSKGAKETVRVLSTFINGTLPHAFEEVQRDLERARMEKEDLRTQSFVPNPDWDWRGRQRTWRHLATYNWERLLDRQGRIERACRIARAGIEDSDNSNSQPTRACRTILAVLDSDHEQSTESDNEEVSEED